VVTLISLMFCGDARSHREAHLHPMVSALIMALTMFWMHNYATTLSERDGSFVLTQYAVPLIAGGASLFYLMADKRPALPSAVSQMVAKAISTARRRLGLNAGSAA
jgi:lipopolysaccharide export system permease protein